MMSISFWLKAWVSEEIAEGWKTAASRLMWLWSDIVRQDNKVLDAPAKSVAK